MHHNKPPRKHLNRRSYDNLVFGRQPVLELLQSEKDVDSLLLQSGAQGDIIFQIREIAGLRHVPIKSVPPEKLNRLTGGTHQGVIAFTAEVSYVEIEDLLPMVIESGEAPLFIVLDGVTDIGNFGAIARTAWAAGAHAIIISSLGAAPVNADAVKASAGALQDLPVCRTDNLAATLAYLQLNGLQIYGADAHASLTPAETDLTLPSVLVVGSEDNGISLNIRSLLTDTIALPMGRNFDSYNVSVAAGMLLYEVLRQRG
jgi:23S rRNA (guanosine2251-2'-O)-methyltransferase